MDAKINEIARDQQEGVEPTGFLSNVIATHQLTPGEIYSSVSELLTAAVDTVKITWIINYIIVLVEAVFLLPDLKN